MTTQQAYAETAIGPDIPIVEAHHHMWPSDRYNRADLERDISQGHRVIKTVFIDCSASYRTDGPDYLKPVGETEWAVSQQGPDGICAGIVGHVDMYLGSQAGEVLDAHLEAGGSSFKGIRHNVAWDRHPDTNNALRGAPEFALLDPVFQAGHGRSGQARPDLRDLAVLQPAQRHEEAGASPAGPAHRPEPSRRPGVQWAVRSRPAGDAGRVAAQYGRPGRGTQRLPQDRRHRLQVVRRAVRSRRAAVIGVPRRVLEARNLLCHRDLRPGAQHVRDQLSGGQAPDRLRRLVEHLQADRGRLQRRRAVVGLREGRQLRLRRSEEGTFGEQSSDRGVRPRRVARRVELASCPRASGRTGRPIGGAGPPDDDARRRRRRAERRAGRDRGGRDCHLPFLGRQRRDARRDRRAQCQASHLHRRGPDRGRSSDPLPAPRCPSRAARRYGPRSSSRRTRRPSSIARSAWRRSTTTWSRRSPGKRLPGCGHSRRPAMPSSRPTRSRRGGRSRRPTWCAPTTA